MSASSRRGNGGGQQRHSEGGLEQRFDQHGLVALRSTVAAHGNQFGLDDAQVDDLVLVAHELATNAVRHGGGKGRLRMWTSDGAVFCEITDDGIGFSYNGADHRSRPALTATGGRGLWIVARLVDVLHVSTGRDGTVATVEIRLR
jgi:anti-sigma regulatory factor (Ser/Thr protein kinase)